MANNNKKHEETATGIESMNESLTSFGGKIEKNKKSIFGIVAAVIVVVLAVFGWIFWNKSNDKKSAQQFSSALVKAQKNINPNEAKAESIYTANLIKELSNVAKTEDGKAGAHQANIVKGALLFQEGKAAEALKALENVDVNEPNIEANVIILRGDCYVDLNKYAEALKQYEEAFTLVKEANPEIAARLLLKKARVLDAQKKYADALAVYELILKDYPQNVAGMNVEAYAERERALAGK